jgi:hypothetical protein
LSLFLLGDLFSALSHESNRTSQPIVTYNHVGKNNLRWRDVSSAVLFETESGQGVWPHRKTNDSTARG